MELTVRRFKELVISENEKQNLISRKSIQEELDLHVVDSRQVLDFISLSGRKVIDIGSGAGFPGLILAVYGQEAEFTLVEADLKKSRFLQAASEQLELSNIKVIRDRVEAIGQNSLYRERFDICTSRAVASMPVILEYSLPLVNSTGQVVMWKGRNYQQEIYDSREALRVLGGRVQAIYQYNLLEERDRVIVVVEKCGPTPAKYPRRVGIPSKRPL